MAQINVKVTFIGDKNVGKSTILLFSEGGGSVFNPDRIGVSVGSEFVSRSITLGPHNFTLGIWDTTGEEDSLTRYLIDAQVVIYVYDITNKEPFDRIEEYLEAAERYTDPRFISFLVGNKADLMYRRDVRYTDAERFADRHNMMFLECSAVTGLNISKLFEKMKKEIAQRKFFESRIFDESTYDILELTDIVTDDKSTQKKKCCFCKKK